MEGIELHRERKVVVNARSGLVPITAYIKGPVTGWYSLLSVTVYSKLHIWIGRCGDRSAVCESRTIENFIVSGLGDFYSLLVCLDLKP